MKFSLYPKRDRVDVEVSRRIDSIIQNNVHLNVSLSLNPYIPHGVFTGIFDAVRMPERVMNIIRTGIVGDE